MDAEVGGAKAFGTKKEFLKQYKKKSRMREYYARFIKNKPAVIGLIIFTLIVLLALMAPLIADYEAQAIKIDVPNRLNPPSMQNLLGTDELGRDVLARLVHGARISLIIGITSVGFGLAISLVIGSISGFFGGRIDFVIMRVIDIFLCLPDVLLALAIVGAFGASQTNLIISIGIASIPWFSRIVRAAVMSVRSNEYVEAARAIGARNGRIITRHILINCIGFMTVQITMRVATAILTISTLSFIGLGIQSPQPEWGNMLATGRTYMRDNAYLVLAPGLATFFTILSLNLLGDGLRDTLDPRLKQ
ncbi:MAG: ABC transporter permease [Oscillospiraceae bacterium]|nr:ABC transporter permease [Oscillospiraceae bacterium]